jgi:hypothetical protein
MLNSLDTSACNGATPASIAANPNTCARPYPAWGGLGGNTYNAISNYNSLQVEVRKRYSNGLFFDANYVWSHMLDDQDSAGWGSTGGNQNWEIGNNPALNYANSNFNVPNSLKGVASYELPFGIGRTYLNKNTALDAALGGWRLSGTLIYQDGSEYTMWVNSGNDYSQAGTWYPNVVPGTSPHLNGVNIGNVASSHPTATWFNTAAFAQPAAGTFGNQGRDSLRGPHLNDINLSFGKTFHYKERFQFELRGDFINAFNHPSFGVPNSNVIAGASEGTITGVANAARTIQVSGRFAF